MVQLMMVFVGIPWLIALAAMWNNEEAYKYFIGLWKLYVWMALVTSPILISHVYYFGFAIGGEVIRG
jgi:hypothetical protein